MHVMQARPSLPFFSFRSTLPRTTRLTCPSCQRSALSASILSPSTLFLFGPRPDLIQPGTNLFRPSSNAFGPTQSYRDLFGPPAAGLHRVWVLHSTASLALVSRRAGRFALQNPRAEPLLLPMCSFASPALGHRILPLERAPIVAAPCLPLRRKRPGLPVLLHTLLPAPRPLLKPDQHHRPWPRWGI